MNKEERTRQFAIDMEMFGNYVLEWGGEHFDYDKTASALDKIGYRKIVWHKVANRDFPPTNKKVLFKLAEYDELTVGFLREDGLFDLETYPGFYGTDADVIAWTDLPTYEE